MENIEYNNVKQTLQRESRLYLIAALLVIIIALGGLLWYLSCLPEMKEQELPPVKSQREKILNQLVEKKEVNKDVEHPNKSIPRGPFCSISR